MSDEKNRRTSSTKSSGSAGNSKSQSSAKRSQGSTSSAKGSSAKSSSARSKKEDFYDYDVKNERSSARTGTKKETGSRAKSEKSELKKLREPEQEPMKKAPDPSAPIHQIAIAVLLAVALFVGICFGFKDDVGVIGGAIQNVFFGLFGLGALMIPFLLVQIALFWKRDVASGAVRYKYIVALFLMLFLSILIHAF